MKSILSEVMDALEDNDDVQKLSREYENIEVVLVGLNSLIDFPKTLEFLEEQLISDGDPGHVDKIGECKEEKNEILKAIFDGKLIIFIHKLKLVLSVEPFARTLSRAIETPSGDNDYLGPLSAFNEDLDTNVGLLRKQYVSENLRVKSYTVGNGQKKVSLLYCKNRVHTKLLDNVINQMESNLDKSVHTMQDATRMLGLPKYHLISPFHTTESPHEVCSNLERGRVVLFLDRLPYALITPSTLWDMFAIKNDENASYMVMTVVRLLRVIGALLGLILPGLYVALVSINPEMLKIELALSVAKTREGVPYPALIEVIFMLIVLELILESLKRLPKSIGPSITMVGGIILGQAVVEAKLVSNLLIIILAATTIASSTIVGTQNTNTIRVFKYLVLIFASIFGVFGVFTGLFLVCAYIASKTTLGVPYISTKGDINSG
ncbi:spore germination protein [Lederbergia graminis]|uniref:Spore germination protein n=1 Tax=Lederbergia graminis TaxID=735518 RepID=A0ABW0LK73_9BACI